MPENILRRRSPVGCACASGMSVVRLSLYVEILAETHALKELRRHFRLNVHSFFRHVNLYRELDFLACLRSGASRQIHCVHDIHRKYHLREHPTGVSRTNRFSY